jgi:hypothetical protein
LLDLLSNPNIFIESTNYLYYLEALNELHSSFLELHLLYDYEILSNIQINQINEDYLVHLEQTSFTLEQSELNDELFYFLLKRSDYYRVVNDYDLAFSTLDLSLLQASSPEQTLLAQTQACLLEEEQYSIQQFGIFDFLNFENACDYTEFPAEFVGNNNGPISIELILTPNPAVEFLNISFGLESNLELQHVFVYDLSGRVLLELNGVSNISTSLDISSLSTGIYVLSAVSTNGLTKSQKFVKYD